MSKIKNKWTEKDIVHLEMDQSVSKYYDSPEMRYYITNPWIV